MTAVFVVLAAQMVVLVYELAVVQSARRARDVARHDRRLVRRMLDEAAFDAAFDADDVIGIAATSTGAGYYLLTAGGEVWWYGDAVWHGDPADDGLPLNAGVTGIAVDPLGRGYWVTAADGGVFTYGPGLGFHGSGPQDDIDEEFGEETFEAREGFGQLLTDAQRLGSVPVTVTVPSRTTLIIDPALNDVTVLWFIEGAAVRRGGLPRQELGYPALLQALIDLILERHPDDVYVDATGTGMPIYESLASATELETIGVRVHRAPLELVVPREILPSTS